MPQRIQTALPVDYGMPSGIEAAVVLILVALGIIKITALLWSRSKKFWALCAGLTGLGLIYIFLTSDPHGLFLSARHGLLAWLKVLYGSFYILAGLFALWMVIDWFRPKRSGPPKRD